MSKGPRYCTTARDFCCIRNIQSKLEEQASGHLIYDKITPAIQWDRLVICFCNEFFKTQWLKTIAIIYFALESAFGVGLRGNSSSRIHEATGETAPLGVGEPIKMAHSPGWQVGTGCWAAAQLGRGGGTSSPPHAAFSTHSWASSQHGC